MSVQKRKEERLRICLEENVEGSSGRSCFERYRFLHNALPDLDLAHVSLELGLWGRKLRGPLLISSMTGGTPQATGNNQVQQRRPRSHPRRASSSALRLP
jgi:isopentenyl-diphosphate delta-isomerase